MRGNTTLKAMCVMLACAGGAGMAVAPAAAQGSYSPYDETPTAALARYVRALADNPKDFASLVGAGRSALELGDTQAAAGFFARADEANPKSPQPQAGMGAVSVANGDARAALPYFTRAKQLGAPVVSFACDRGLAYDLLGRQAEAQADYSIALSGADRDEASRRLALSLAISGKRAEAIALLGPLMAKGDAAAARTRAFVLALTGDASGARSPSMPPCRAAGRACRRSWPGCRRCRPGKRPPPSTSASFRIRTPVPLTPVPRLVRPFRQRRDRLRRSSTATGWPGSMPCSKAPEAAPPGCHSAGRSAANATAGGLQFASTKGSGDPGGSGGRIDPAGKIWLQLASGHNADDLPSRYRHFARGRDLFDGIRGYVAEARTGCAW